MKLVFLFTVLATLFTGCNTRASVMYSGNLNYPPQTEEAS